MEETILELVDPNDGTHARHQYMVSGGILYHRRLPATGNRWADDPGDAPWWEVVREITPGTPTHKFWCDHGGNQLSVDMRPTLVALTPNGREVTRLESGELGVQPEHDNYLVRCSDLKGARKAYYEGAANRRAK